MNRLLLFLAALLACGLIAGCGDDDDDNGDDSPAATESAPVEPTNTDAALDACKRRVDATSGQLSEGVRSDLEDICEEAAGGDEEDLREASRDICRRVVEETVPEGQPAREQALEACDSAAAP